MNNKLEQLSEKAIDKMLQYAQTAEDFAVSEAPKYIKEFLEYEAWYHSTWFAMAILGLIVSVNLKILVKFKVKDEGDKIGLFAVLFVFSLFFTVTGVDSFLKVNKIKMAPRVYILESLTNKGCGR